MGTFSNNKTIAVSAAIDINTTHTGVIFQTRRDTLIFTNPANAYSIISIFYYNATGNNITIWFGTTSLGNGAGENSDNTIFSAALGSSAKVFQNEIYLGPGKSLYWGHALGGSAIRCCVQGVTFLNSP